jgi:hypothetical protein
MITKKSPSEIAVHFVAHCRKNEITIERCENILTLTKRIPASIGGMTALNTGRFRLNRSGVQKRVLKAIREAAR